MFGHNILNLFILSILVSLLIGGSGLIFAQGPQNNGCRAVEVVFCG